jgi:hypothetical protein
VKKATRIIDSLGSQMEQIDSRVFDRLVPRGKHSWVEMADKSGLGEK